MKYFKLLVCVFCLGLLMTACGVTKKMSSPDKPPTCQIETVQRASHS